MALVEQVQPSMRLLDHQAAKRKCSSFLRPLYKCAVFLTSECRSFDRDLVSRFCITLLRERASCSFNDFTINARKICSCVDLNWDDGPSIFLEVLRITRELSLCECKALSYAKEALNLCKSLLHRKFEFSPKKPDVPLKRRDSVSTETWPDFTRADTIMDSFLSHWIVLRFYLESTFQVGSIYESIGNGAKAESMFQTGKEMSDLHALHSFEIIFASSLGQLYRKQQLWDMADSELRRAQKLLEESEPALSCKNCKMFLETTVNLQLGDLLRSRFKNRSLEDALCTYQSAFDKLDHHELEFPKKEEAETNKQLNSTCKCCMLLNKKASNSDTKKLMRTTRARSCKTSTVTKTKEEPATEFNNSKKMGKKPSPKCNGDVSCNEQ